MREWINIICEASDEKLDWSLLRQYTFQELANESDEYFKNPSTLTAMPNFFEDIDDFIRRLKRAKLHVLTSEEISRLENSDAAEVIDDPDRAKDLALEYERDIEAIWNAFAHRLPIPPPIVLQRGKRLYLLAGNTRLMAAVSRGLLLPVLIVPSNTKNIERFPVN